MHTATLLSPSPPRLSARRTAPGPRAPRPRLPAPPTAGPGAPSPEELKAMAADPAMRAQLEQAMKDPAVQVCVYLCGMGRCAGVRGREEGEHTHNSRPPDPRPALLDPHPPPTPPPLRSPAPRTHPPPPSFFSVPPAQMAEMQAVMSNAAVQERMASLRSDPDLAPMFEDIQKGGVGALMKYMNDPAWLAKVGSRMGDVTELLAAGGGGAGGAGGGPPPGTPPRPPVAATSINSLFDAAKAGDLEAVEDYLAIGKDPAEADGAGRTPLHAAAAYDRLEAAAELVKAGAPLDAADGEGNTPLHYAAGYGRPRVVELLVRAGASGAAENAKGQTPVELVTGEPRNPINGLADVLAVLENAAVAGAEME